jgi:hypothetical protein
MELKSKVVMVEGFGEVEIREPLFETIEAFFNGGDAKTFGTSMLKKCLYSEGKLIFDQPVGASLGIKLMKLAPEVMEMVGFNEESGNDLPTANQ